LQGDPDLVAAKIVIDERSGIIVRAATSASPSLAVAQGTLTVERLPKSARHQPIRCRAD